MNFHRVVTCSNKGLYLGVLFECLKKQFNLPPIIIYDNNSRSAEFHVIDKKYKDFINREESNIQLLKEEEELVSRISRLLEMPGTTKSFNPDEISLNDVQRLLANSISDLTMLGLYVLSLLPNDIDLTILKENKSSAKNYARFLIVEKSVNPARDIDMGASAKHICSLVIL